MYLVRCSACGLEIGNTNRTTCPRCGAPLLSTGTTGRQRVPPPQVPPTSPTSPGASRYPAQQSMRPPGPPNPPLEQRPTAVRPAARRPVSPGKPHLTLPSNRRPNRPAQPSSMSQWDAVDSLDSASDTGDVDTMIAPAESRTATGRYKRYGLGKAPPYPVLSPQQEKRRAPLIMGVLSAVIVVALLFGVGAVLLGHRAATAQTPPTASSVRTSVATSVLPNTLYQSALLGVANGWITDAHCAAKADGYHITGASLCYAPVGAQANVDITVTVKQLSGPLNLFYGIVLRQSGNGNYYFFGIDGNGKWTFARLSNNTSSFLVHPAGNSAIKSNLKQTNVMEVKGIGSHFQFFVNGTSIGQSDDATYASGLIGLTSGNGIEVAYTNITITQLPG